MANVLRLQWGTVKSWDLETDEAIAALKKWAAPGISMSAAMEKDTAEQKDALCELIDHMDEIWNVWDGVQMTHDEAKAYVRNNGA